jgi:hypothetical protein
MALHLTIYCDMATSQIIAHPAGRRPLRRSCPSRRASRRFEPGLSPQPRRPRSELKVTQTIIFLPALGFLNGSRHLHSGRVTFILAF